MSGVNATTWSTVERVSAGQRAQPAQHFWSAEYLGDGM
jgi:hypothetical protein